MCSGEVLSQVQSGPFPRKDHGHLGKPRRMTFQQELGESLEEGAHDSGEDRTEDQMEHPPFPTYRQLRGGASYYCILAVDHFQELQRIGSRWILHDVQATAYPERLRVHEMLAGTAPFEGLEEAEWERAYTRRG